MKKREPHLTNRHRQAVARNTWLPDGLAVRSLVLAAALGCAAGCSDGVRRFPLAPPRWEDFDRNHVPKAPREYYSGMIADAADKNVLRPLARLPYLPLPEKAKNVNALDEVPNSAWFQNRIGYHVMTEAEVAQGACGDAPPLDPQSSWEITGAKPNGAYPGFFIRAGGQHYLLKFDSAVQPGRATSADVIGSKIYHAVGYHTPCNEVVYFERDVLHIAEDATAEDRYGRKRPITEQDINQVLAKAYRTKSGLLRASASRFLPGRPIGPFKYQGRRGDDPNDHVLHQHRRELRANRLLSAWLHHHDAREQNTLDVWIENAGPDQRDYIRHYMIDWGDCLGSRWAFDPLSKRFGYAYLIDFDQALIDFLTLGAYPRPWHHLEVHPDVEIFGYFNVKDFRPKEWVTEYPNSAFSEMRYDDALWMARILAQFSVTQLRAVVREARLENPDAEKYLLATLLGRRRVIFQEYFTEYAPLAGFQLWSDPDPRAQRVQASSLVREDPAEQTHSQASPGETLCFRDLAIEHGIVDPALVLYKARFYGGRKLDEELGWVQLQPDPAHPAWTCVMLPLGDVRPSDLAPKGARDDHALRYSVLKIWIHQEPGVRPTSAVHVYFYDLGKERGYRLVGIERPQKPAIPSLY